MEGTTCSLPTPQKGTKYKFFPVCLAAASPKALLVYSLTPQKKEKRKINSVTLHFQ